MFDLRTFSHVPVCENWGGSRGQPVDRFYIEAFLQRHASDIRGRVLEVGDSVYTRRFGGTRVETSDVVDIAADNKAATLIADLTDAPHLPSEGYDCIILTQVLVLIRDVRKAVATVSRVLKPGGVALITVPGISQISVHSGEAEHWYWSFYPNSLRWILSDQGFDESTMLVEGWGNLKTTVAFLAGFAQEDLEISDFLVKDVRYPLIVSARVEKRRSDCARASAGSGFL